MKRSRPRQHRRKLGNGRTITVNKGVSRGVKRRYPLYYGEHRKVDVYNHAVAANRIKQLRESIDKRSSSINKLQETVAITTDDALKRNLPEMIREGELRVAQDESLIKSLNKRYFPENPH